MDRVRSESSLIRIRSDSYQIRPNLIHLLTWSVMGDPIQNWLFMRQICICFQNWSVYKPIGSKIDLESTVYLLPYF